MIWFLGVCGHDVWSRWSHSGVATERTGVDCVCARPRSRRLRTRLPHEPIDVRVTSCQVERGGRNNSYRQCKLAVLLVQFCISVFHILGLGSCLSWDALVIFLAFFRREVCVPEVSTASCSTLAHPPYSTTSPVEGLHSNMMDRST